MIKNFIIIAFLVFIGSCKKLVEVDAPIDRITSKEVFSSDASAMLAMNGLYNKMMAEKMSITSGGMTIYCGLAADELVNTTPGEEDEFSSNDISVSNFIVQQNLWSSAYSLIYHVNSILSGLNNSRDVSDKMKKQLTGEAKFCRAFLYFNLVNLFGNVPLVVSTDYKVSSKLGRTLSKDVYEQIKQDLEDASQLLPKSSDIDKTKPTRWEVLSLLSRVHLYLKNWNEALRLSSIVLDSSGLQLEIDLGAVFKLNSTETIWQLRPVVTGINTWEGNSFIPGNGAIPNYILRNELVASFDSVDQRRSKWMQTDTVAGASYTFPFKYKAKSGTSIIECYVMQRLAELYLIRAEAHTRLSDFSSALSNLNTIRRRAGLTDVNSSNENELLTAIEKERARELFSEWGHRWLDLKRSERSTIVLSTIKPAWQPTDTLFPVPLNEIRKNVNLRQNPGY